jgi:protein-S-isoprenylcysteine O-methyltransferase Ste14
MHNVPTMVAVAVLLPVAGSLVFRKAARDYSDHGRLTRASAALEVAVFACHGAASLVFLDSRLSAIDTGNPLFGFGLVFIGGGLVLLLTTIVSFGVKRAAGRETSGLTCSGMYRRSRNPQVIFYGIAVLGYSLLWPSWTGAVWVILYIILAEMMVRTEETHLKQTFGAEFVGYCESTPRYIDVPRRK